MENNKINQLRKLIEISVLKPQEKTNKIIQTLQRTEDIMKAKMLLLQIQNNDYSHLQEKTVDDLINAFDTMEDTGRIGNDEDYNKDSFVDNKKQNLEYNNQQQLKNKINQQQQEIERLKKINEELMEKLSLTKNSQLITISDEDINSLYVERLKDNRITSYGEAFVLGDIIPKSYYKINES